MNLSELEAKLLAAARRDTPGDGVPYAFEKRVMAHLKPARPVNAWASWSAPLWRAAVCCVALTVVCGVWSYSSAPRRSEPAGDLSQDLASAVFAPMDQPSDDTW